MQIFFFIANLPFFIANRWLCFIILRCETWFSCWLLYYDTKLWRFAFFVYVDASIECASSVKRKIFVKLEWSLKGIQSRHGVIRLCKLSFLMRVKFYCYYLKHPIKKINHTAFDAIGELLLRNNSQTTMTLKVDLILFY